MMNEWIQRQIFSKCDIIHASSPHKRQQQPACPYPAGYGQWKSRGGSILHEGVWTAGGLMFSSCRSATVSKKDCTSQCFLILPSCTTTTSSQYCIHAPYHVLSIKTVFPYFLFISTNSRIISAGSLRIQSGCRLIQHQHIRVHGKDSGNGNSSLLSPG